MELGEKIRAARLAAGLSQRQLCGETITRNMLSQIEHGTARPSMDTLRILAARLDLPVSYFLEETVLTSPNRTVMDRARAAFDSQDLSGAVQALEDYRGPDPVYDRERQLLEYLLRLELAQNALDQGKEILARELLTHMPQPSYARYALDRRRRLLLSRLPGADPAALCEDLPSLDDELLLRARAAREPARGIRLLEAMEAPTPEALLLLGNLRMELKDYPGAIDALLMAEPARPLEAAKLLEVCYRELEDYRSAYHWACKQR